MDFDLTILYGSQTGNAEDLAKRIGLEAKRRGVSSLQVLSVDDFNLKLLPKIKFVLFVCATTGHGQEPENMKNFYNFIRRRDLPNDCLRGLKFAIYGLGSSSYAKFNYVSKILFKRLSECGAEPLQELVASDEQHRFGCDGLIYPKLDELWPGLGLDSGTSLVKQDDEKRKADNSYEVSFYDKDGDFPEPVDKFKTEFIAKYKIGAATCIVNDRLTPESHFQDTRLLCYKAHNPISYEPGDVCTIYPQNSDSTVQSFINLLRLDPKSRIRITKRDPNYMINYLYDFIPDGLKVEDLVRYYLDIQSVPKRSFFEYLWPLSDNELEREKLKEFATTEGQAELYEYCVRPKRSILETLMDFPNTVGNIKFEYLFDLIPPIKPRSFSIASSLRAHPNEIHLLVGVVNYKTSMRSPRLGLCSNYLASMKVNRDPVEKVAQESMLRFFIRNTAFKLPRDLHQPIIMIGPGLGLSPFRAFIEERAIRLEEEGDELRREVLPASFLYFGCRYEEMDYYFRQSLEEYSEKCVIKLAVAFSRHKPKQYVQDLIAQDAHLIGQLIKEKNALVYVAGNSKLPENLRSLLGEILSEGSEFSGDPEGIATRLEMSNRIRYDCW